MLLVDTASSTAGRQWESGPEYVFSMDTDHKHMVKFAEMDPSYDDFLFILRDRFLPGACSVIGKRFQEPDPLGTERLEKTVHAVAPERAEPSESPAVKFPCVMPPYHGRATIQYRGQ